ERCAEAAGVRIVDENEEPDIVIALGGDGTMLQALRAQRGTGKPVFGINFGRVGFLTSAEAEELEPALGRVFFGDYRVVELATLAAEAPGVAESAVNDVVVTSSRPGRMV